MSPPTARWLKRDDSAHAVQFYTEDGILLSGSASFLETALRAGNIALVLATPEHIAALEQRITTDGVDVASAAANGRYHAYDGNKALDAFMVGGWPDAALFVRRSEVTSNRRAQKPAAGIPGWPPLARWWQFYAPKERWRPLPGWKDCGTISRKRATFRCSAHIPWWHLTASSNLNRFVGFARRTPRGPDGALPGSS